MPNALVIGSGFSGAAAALLLTQKGIKVTVVERDPFLGGGCKTHVYGGHPYTFGPRHFLSPEEKVFEWLHQYTPMRRIPDHEFLTYVERDPGWYHFPIHQDDIALMPDQAQILQELEARDLGARPGNLEEYWKQAVGPTLYSKFVETYTRKMWGLQSNTEFDEGTWSIKSTPLKRGPKAAWTEAISAFPYAMNGYDDFFTAAVAGCEVLLGTSVEAFDVDRHRVKLLGEWRGFDLIISTIPPETLMNNAFGPLRWMGRELLKIVLPVPEVFPPNVYFLYYANNEPFTRMVEYKKFYRYEAPTTLLCLEIPSEKNKLGMYPYPMAKEQAIARKYFDALPDRVFSIGRAGSYDYTIGIARAIQQAMALVEGL